MDGVVGPWLGRVPVKLLRLEHVSASSARASGLAVAVGELVLCSDDDCRPDPGILRAYAEAARELAAELLGCEMPYCCPEGHPTMIQISFQELGRKFGKR